MIEETDEKIDLYEGTKLASFVWLCDLGWNWRFFLSGRKRIAAAATLASDKESAKTLYIFPPSALLLQSRGSHAFQFRGREKGKGPGAI